MAKKYAVELSKEEQELLNQLITSGIQRVRKTKPARILLKADAGWTDQAIAEALECSLRLPYGRCIRCLPASL